MTLHSQMATEYEHLVVAERVGQYPCCAGWNAESFSVPLKDYGASIAGECVSKPFPGFRVVFGPNRTPTDLLHRIRCDLSSERFAHQLSAETMANDGDVFGDRFPNQVAALFDPRERVVDADCATHQADSGERLSARGHVIASVNGDQAPGNRVLIQECGKIAWPFGSGVTKNGDWFHESTLLHERCR